MICSQLKYIYHLLESRIFASWLINYCVLCWVSANYVYVIDGKTKNIPMMLECFHNVVISLLYRHCLGWGRILVLALSVGYFIGSVHFLTEWTLSCWECAGVAVVVSHLFRLNGSVVFQIPVSLRFTSQPCCPKAVSSFTRPHNHCKWLGPFSLPACT